MTDKQIIFKCDVDCTLKDTEECLQLDCIKGQESILKQLQAKEQECEQLRGELCITEENLKDYIEHYNRQCEQLDQLKAENEELKKNYFTVIQQRNKAEQTLAQIKEMCNSVENIENVKSLYDAAISGMYLQAKTILKKISECED